MTEATDRLHTTTPSPFIVSFDNLNSANYASLHQPQHSHSRQTSLASSTVSRTASIILSPTTTAAIHPLQGERAAPSSKPSVTLNQPETGTETRLSTLLSFTALSLGLFLVALDTVLIPTALPTISLSFHIPDSLYAWTGSAYLLVNAASIPCWGTLSDIFGRKPMILIANAVFFTGSIICATSVNAPMLVTGRAVQGLGGGGVNVLVYVCVTDLFAIRLRSFYLSIVGAVWAVASALGPVLGGVFAEKLNWRWCFYINLPITFVATLLLFFTLHLPSTRMPLWAGLRSLDWPGTFTILSATLLLLIGLQLGGQQPNTYAAPGVICLIVFGIILFIIFPFTQWHAERSSAPDLSTSEKTVTEGGRPHTNPLMPLHIFRSLSNLCALGVCAADALVFNSIAYFVPLYLQLILALSPSTSGVYMLALAIPLALVSFASGWIMRKTGRFIEVLQIGLALMTIGVSLLISLSSTTSGAHAKVIGFLVLLGIGFGPNFHAPLLALQAKTKAADMGAATSAFGFVRMVSGAMGVVIGQVVFSLLLHPHLDSFREAGVDAGLAQRLSGGQAVSEARNVAGLPEMQRIAVRRGFGESLRGTWIFYAGVSGVGLLVSFGIVRVRMKSEGEEVRNSSVRE
ncbi:MFS general substrate transporter [Lophiostoma macrostomum CBS 122681]|uniref:MFS general substrate transporter n=1 Tax=Lophiostoma macrostomum CBS 122681 TaxID=1314788 RepID=A0A6A6SMZ3_9PLEO|nr:MFS general substrate transporter [Lophiostoma macrostomum CBS 122681]